MMKLAFVDTNIVSLFFRNQPLVIEKFNAYIKEYGKIGVADSMYDAGFYVRTKIIVET